MEQVSVKSGGVFLSNCSDLVKVMVTSPGRRWCVSDFLKFGSRRVIVRMLDYLVSIGYVVKLKSYPRFYVLR